MRSLMAAGVMLAFCSAAEAQNFGHFEPDTIPTRMLPRSQRGLVLLTEDYRYTDPNGMEWVSPEGEISDGASIPEEAMILTGGRYDGAYLPAAVIHDYYYCAKTREFFSVNLAFWLGMQAQGVPELKATAMEAAVRMFGPERWEVDPAHQPNRPCNTIASYPDERDWLTLRIRDSALSKLGAMVRFLVASGGRVIDVVSGEVIEARTPEADQHIELLREAISRSFDIPDRDRLGYLTALQPEEFGLPDANPNELPMAAPWAGGQIAALDDYLGSRGLMIAPPAIVNGGVYFPASFDTFDEFAAGSHSTQFLTDAAQRR